MLAAHFQRARTALAHYDLGHCPACGNEHDAPHLHLARRWVQAVACSADCQRTVALARVACCTKAEQICCVCEIAFSCPVHGERHFGTHD